ncbi:STAS domain-containing protein [Peribacillus sp. SCS-155]|uniref:STAS domain-containing protein n=1 Tax=Peribacillus sedimenti TaxID=3115297 RepID=UPI003905BB0F
MSESKVKVQVNTNEFIWDIKEGLFTFDGAPALLFWDSAIELFLKTIEEVSGPEVSKTVYEATGYRMGHLVSSYYLGRTDIEQLLKEYSNIYRNAGWGNVTIAEYSLEEKRAVVRLTNSWEHRVFKQADKEKAAVLLPSHWAGVFTGLFQQNMWYNITKSQVNGCEYDEIEIFPSSITPAKNIHELTREKEREYIQDLEKKVQDRTKELTSLVRELSSPIIPVLNGILVTPLIGNFNEERLSDLMERALIELSSQKANYLLIDLTGITNVDVYTISGIQRLIQAIRLLGGECLIVGVSSELSIQITQSKVNMAGINSFSSLQQGVTYALQQSGYELLKKN